MEAKKRARVAAVVGLIVGRMPVDPRRRIVSGSGPTVREVVATILAVEAVATVKGDAATAAATATAHIASGRAVRIADAVGNPLCRIKTPAEGPRFDHGGLRIHAGINEVEIRIALPHGGMIERVLLSHAEDRCILAGDAATTIDAARLDIHVQTLAEEVHAVNPGDMTLDEMLDRLRRGIQEEATDDHVRINVRSLPGSAAWLTRDMINHQSIEAWRNHIAQVIRTDKVDPAIRASVLERCETVRSYINDMHEAAGRGRSARTVERGGRAYVEIPTITERFVAGTMMWSAVMSHRMIKVDVENEIVQHRKRAALLAGRAPAARHEDVDLDMWRFDPVLLRLVAAHAADPEDALRRLVFGPGDEHVVGRNHVLGPCAPAFTTRIGRLELGIRIGLAAGIAWRNGSLVVDLDKISIPGQLLGTMAGRKLGEVASHPLLDPEVTIDAVTVADAKRGAGTAVIQPKRRMVPHQSIVHQHLKALAA